MGIAIKKDYGLKELWGDELSKLFLFRQKLKRNYRDYGFWTSWKKTSAYILSPIYKKVVYYIYELDLNKSIEQKKMKIKYDYRMINPSEWRMIEQIENMEEWLKGQFRNKLEKNCLCMVVLDGKIVAGFNYVSIGEGYIPHLKLKIILNKNEAWSEQITISSDYRKQGLGNELRNQFYRKLREMNIKALYGHRQEFNVASRNSAKKYTSDVLIRAEFRQILGFEKIKCVKLKNKENERRFYLKYFRGDSPKKINKEKNDDIHFCTNVDVFK